MAKRYTELMPLLFKINHGSVADHGLESYLLSRRDSNVRRLFNHVLAEYPQLDACLGTAAAISNNQPLESGIVKMQRHEALNAAERSAAFKRHKSHRRQRYMDVVFVPPTSNERERFFSAARLVLTDLRNIMESERLEAVMPLLINRELWDVYAVETIRHRIGENARD
ncbi:hypothetical protein PI124_g16696 [Phytophthora idaei]|nr:hypothetical protein PI125_g23871 [Phytophthora idaei]KAG3238344.1 hypothetical protein PI124_g16696 [Phytophthora idaei]